MHCDRLTSAKTVIFSTSFVPIATGHLLDLHLRWKKAITTVRV